MRAGVDVEAEFGSGELDGAEGQLLDVRTHGARELGAGASEVRSAPRLASGGAIGPRAAVRPRS